MAKTAANLTDIINADALRALITEAAKAAAPEIKPISELVEFTDPQTGETAQRAANVEALRDMARIYNASRADLPRNIYLYGGAGTGKSTLAADFADAINRPFYALTLGYDTTKSDILGYKTISGEYVSTPIIDAFEGGGVLLLDELDACGGQALLYINNILSTRVGAAIKTPRGKATRHPEFICIATGNTIGTGATNKFCGRSALDDSTRRRFAFLEVKTPRSLEISQTSAEFVEWLDGARERIKQSSTEIEINLRDAIAIFDIERKFDNDRRAALKIVFPELDADNIALCVDVYIDNRAAVGIVDCLGNLIRRKTNINRPRKRVDCYNRSFFADNLNYIYVFHISLLSSKPLFREHFWSSASFRRPQRLSFCRQSLFRTSA